MSVNFLPKIEDGGGERGRGGISADSDGKRHTLMSPRASSICSFSFPLMTKTKFLGSAQRSVRSSFKESGGFVKVN